MGRVCVVYGVMATQKAWRHRVAAAVEDLRRRDRLDLLHRLGWIVDYAPVARERGDEVLEEVGLVEPWHTPGTDACYHMVRPSDLGQWWEFFRDAHPRVMGP